MCFRLEEEIFDFVRKSSQLWYYLWLSLCLSPAWAQGIQIRVWIIDADMGRAEEERLSCERMVWGWFYSPRSDSSSCSYLFFTYSQNGQGRKGPLEIIWSNSPAKQSCLVLVASVYLFLYTNRDLSFCLIFPLSHHQSSQYSRAVSVLSNRIDF